MANDTGESSSIDKATYWLGQLTDAHHEIDCPNGDRSSAFQRFNTCVF
jgi:hypothetical protein